MTHIMLPCPFCGSAEVKVAKRDVEPQGDSWYGTKVELFPECQNCACVLFDKYWHDGFSDNAAAIVAWNTRTDPAHASLTAQRDELLAALLLLYAMVKGEAPRLLEDWHGDDLIRAALARATQEAGR